MRDFQDRHVVVTGGTGALGSAVVAALLERGAICHLPVRDASGPEAPRERVQVVPHVDLTSDAAVDAFYAGRPGLWASIHCAGGFALAPIAESTGELLGRMWSINAVSCHACCREATRSIRRTGSGGRLVNVAARPAVEPGAGAGMIAYAMSKAAVSALTASLARELLDEKIWVNAVVPSLLDTPDNRKAMPRADWSRWPKLEEVAELIVWLASPRNATTSGALVPAYGRA